LLSQDPSNYPDAPTEGIRRILEIVTGQQVPRGVPLPTNKIGKWSSPSHAWHRTDNADTVRLSTTVATNALLERRGAPHALLITKGFKDLLSIGNQARPRIFDLHIKKASTLYGDVVEVDERVTLVGYTSDPEHASHAVQWTEDGQVAKAYGGIGAQNGLGESGNGSIVQGLSGEAVHILKKLDQDVVSADLQKLYDQGYRSVAVVLAHS
jgi:5-oxoprolinase (ATP-hydrolysing)